MDEIYDVHGVRVILENKADCFTTLEVVHHLWPRIPGKFKDYVSSPKSNGYDHAKYCYTTMHKKMYATVLT
jgi:GTP pyrophosphokinase